MANSVANTLSTMHNQKIAVLCKKSVWTLACFLGIMKSGNCYIPIDIEYPKDRIDYILKNSDSSLLITSKDNALADNYKNNGPYFEKSYKYLNDKKLSFDNDMDILIEYCNERNIKKMIKNKNLSDYYVNLYDSLMLNDNMTKDFEDSRLLLEDYKNNMDKLFDNTKAVLDYLFTQKGNWEIQDDKILFKENSMIDQYNLLISKVNKKTNN